MITKLLIVEDNKDLVDYIKEFLNTHGEFNVISYTSGVAALKYLKSEKPDIIIIDLQLEDIQGETVCKEARKTYPDLPIIILTGDKSQNSIISCLNSGADDYITKPFNSDEFLARVKARLRNSTNNNASNIITCSDLTLNTDTLEVTRKGEKVELTAKEFELLKYLMVNKFRVSTRDKILFAVWGYTTDVDTRVVDVHVGKLRKKLNDASDDGYIESVRGYGYRMIEE